MSHEDEREDTESEEDVTDGLHLPEMETRPQRVRFGRWALWLILIAGHETSISGHDGDWGRRGWEGELFVEVEDIVEVFDGVFLGGAHEVGVNEGEDDLSEIAGLVDSPVVEDGFGEEAVAGEGVLAET